MPPTAARRVTERRPPPRRSYAVGRERRQQILVAAHELFSSQGFRGTSLRDVATRVNLTLPGLLHHFPSKEALLEGVLQERDLTDTPWFLDKWEETASFRQAVKELVARNLENREMVQLFTTLSAEATDPEHPAHGYFQRRYEESRELFSTTLATARQRGETRPGASGPVLIAVMDGLQVQWLLDQEFDFLGELDHYLDTILIDEQGTKKK